MSPPKKESARRRAACPAGAAAEASAGIDFCEGMLINLILKASLVLPQAPAAVHPPPRRT